MIDVQIKSSFKIADLKEWIEKIRMSIAETHGAIIDIDIDIQATSQSVSPFSSVYGARSWNDHKADPIVTMYTAIVKFTHGGAQ